VAQCALEFRKKVVKKYNLVQNCLEKTKEEREI